MENPSSPESADRDWVDACLDSLTPPAEWEPDAPTALKTLLERPPATRSRGTPLMAAIVVVGAAAVVLALPWRLLWTPSPAPNPAISTGELPGGVPAHHVEPVNADLADLISLELSQDVPVRHVETFDAGDSDLPTQAAQPETMLQQTPPGTLPGQAPPGVLPGQTPPGTPPFPTQPGLTPGQIQPGTLSDPLRGDLPNVLPNKGAKKSYTGATAPLAVSTVSPQYTQEAREARLQGTVVLAATVHPDGTLTVDGVTQSLGHGLDESAIAAAEQWRFTPGEMNGVPVDVKTSIQVHFILK